MSKRILNSMVLKSLFEDVDGKELLQELIESGVVSKEQVEEYYKANIKSQKQITPTYSEIKDGVLVKFNERDLAVEGEYVTPNGVVKIGRRAFAGCDHLHKVHLSKDVVEIGAGAFDSCRYLKTVTMTDSVLEMGSSAFASCLCLSKLELSENIKDIRTQTFVNCVNLEEIMLPEKVETIDDYAFGNCQSLTTISQPTEKLLWVHSNAFEGAPIKKDFMRKFKKMQAAQKQEQGNTK